MGDAAAARRRSCSACSARSCSTAGRRASARSGGAAGIGLVIGAVVAHAIGPRISFRSYKRVISVCYVVHGGAYVVFSQMRNYCGRAVLHRSVARGGGGQLGAELLAVAASCRRRISRARLRDHRDPGLVDHDAVDDGRGHRVADHVSRERSASVAGILSSTTAIFWGWANWTGRLPEPPVRRRPGGGGGSR